LEANFEIF
jgi:hypothetical protein